MSHPLGQRVLRHYQWPLLLGKFDGVNDVLVVGESGDTSLDGDAVCELPVRSLVSGG